MFGEVSSYKLHKYLYNKSVALVGGADTIDKRIIDTADVVVRVNQHFLRQGGRCNALYTATCDPLLCTWEHTTGLCYMLYCCLGQYWKDYRHYCERFGITGVPYVNEMYGKPNPYGPQYEWLNIFNRQLGTKPFTGTMAIKHLTSFPIKSLYITGMDFHTGHDSYSIGPLGQPPTRLLKTLDDSTILKRGPHAIKPQAVWLRDYMKCDKRIVVDEQLRLVLKECETWSFE